MREAFEQSGVWTSTDEGIPAAHYTKPGDPFRFDFGYRVGRRSSYFHAVSLKTSVEQAITLAARYPKIAEASRRRSQTNPSLTAVIGRRPGPDAGRSASLH